MQLASLLLVLLPSLAAAVSVPSSLKRQYTPITEGQEYRDPPGDARRVHPYGRFDLCMGVEGGTITDGAAVGVMYCQPTNGTYAAMQFWNAPAGDSAKFRLNGTTFCLDVGYGSDGDLATIRGCGGQENQGQAFVYQDREIRKQDSNQCVDVQQESEPITTEPYAVLKQIQTYECFQNQNQFFSLWDLREGD